jgi:hypothetical protein
MWSPVTLHNASSHENDGSKYLKNDRMVLVHYAAITAPELSCVQLRRNMHLDSPSKKMRQNLSDPFSAASTMSEKN